MNNDPQLTVLSYGGGQHSFALLLLLLFDEEVRQTYAPNDFIVVFADTTVEKPQTYEHINEVVKPLCKEHEILFQHVHPDLDFHPESWKGFWMNYEKNQTIGSVSMAQTCTHNLKIVPIDNFVEYYINWKYQQWQHESTPYPGRKRAFYNYQERFGCKVRYLIGFDADENRTLTKDPALWKQRTVEKYCPLQELDYSRQMCMDLAVAFGFPVPMPSACLTCFYQNLPTLLWLYRYFPEVYNRWVRMERAKLKKHAHLGSKNNGVFGPNMTIPKRLALAEKKYGHWDAEQLHEYVMSHGHCVKSKY